MKANEQIKNQNQNDKKDVNFKKIHDNQLERMKAYIESIDNTPYKIYMIKNAVWPLDSKTNPPCNSIISKVLKKKLKLLYKNI